MRYASIFAAALCMGSVAHGQLPGEADFTELAKASAALNGITVAEAIRRAELQGRIIDLQNRYLERFPNEFAGIVIEPSPTRYTFKVLLKGGPKNALLELAKSPDLAALGREEAVARSFADLQREQVRLLDALEASGVRAASSINLAENSVSVVVPDKARVDALIASGTLAIPGFAAVRQGNPTVIDDATIRGGLEVEGVDGGCQTGFSVRNYSGVRGVVTAAHCEDSLTTVSGGANVGGLQQATSAAQYTQGIDIQWHASTANVYTNQVQYGTNLVSITGTAGVSVMQPNVTEVCLVRWRTQTTSCGRIYSTSYYVQHPIHGRSGPFVGVTPVGSLLLSEQGDSGGPWFFGNRAYGVHSGRFESVSFFTPADKFGTLSVVVQTSP